MAIERYWRRFSTINHFHFHFLFAIHCANMPFYFGLGTFCGRMSSEWPHKNQNRIKNKKSLPLWSRSDVMIQNENNNNPKTWKQNIAATTVIHFACHSQFMIIRHEWIVFGCWEIHTSPYQWKCTAHYMHDIQAPKMYYGHGHTWHK